MVAALALGALPWRLVASATLVVRDTSSSERQQEERSEELVESPTSLKVYFTRRHGTGGFPTNAWLVLRLPRSSPPLLRGSQLEHEDPRRVLIPLRIDPPPDGLV